MLLKSFTNVVCAHILNLIVQDGLKEIGDSIKKLESIQISGADK